MNKLTLLSSEVSDKWLRSRAEWYMVSGGGAVILFSLCANPFEVLGWHTLIMRSNIVLYFQTKEQRNKLLYPEIFRKYSELDKKITQFHH
jgi:hypothetical protein